MFGSLLRRVGMVVLACLLLVGGSSTAQAQEDYLFTVDRNISQVTIHPDDRSAMIEYWLTFTCAPGAHPIDWVDVGLPYSGYTLSEIQAWYRPGTGVDGTSEVALTGLEDSPYLDSGVAVPLGEYAIQPGEQGTVYFRAKMRYMVHPNYSKTSQASLQFSPTFFGSAFVQGTTYLEVRFLFPPGVTAEQARYHSEPFTEADVVDGRVRYIYIYPQARGDETHRLGISFPRKYVSSMRRSVGEVVEDALDALFRPVKNMFERAPQVFCIGSIGLAFIVLTGAQELRRRRRRMQYLTPTMSIEGVGIKRGLTAVEAAVLLETPLNTVLTMILFGVLKKGGVVVLKQRPLRLQVVDPLPEVEWHGYEETFILSIGEDGILPERELQSLIVELVRSVNNKIRGFSRKDTVAYYRSIVDRAWEQVQDAETPDVQAERFAEDLEWTMLDRNFEHRSRDAFQDAPVPVPQWWQPYVTRPVDLAPQRSDRSSLASDIPLPKRPDLGERAARVSVSADRAPLSLPVLPGASFASSIVDGIENMAGSIVSRVETFTGGVTARTNPRAVSTYQSSSSSSRSSGSSRSSFSSGSARSSSSRSSRSSSSSRSSCACACACAGCACACAGGGR